VEEFVAALTAHPGDVAARFAALGFGADVLADTLADVPRKVAAYGTTGDVAIDVGWLRGLARADVVALGRLQFERVPHEGPHAVHVPEGGPLTDADLDVSFSRARDLLRADGFSCHSWLLDPLLTDLGPDSGVVRFARRFTVGPVERDTAADQAVAKFVFRSTPDAVRAGDVVPRTRVARLVADHLRAGGHWAQPLGFG
jgi:hypothetical protein